MGQRLLFPDFSVPELDSEHLGRWADECLARLEPAPAGARDSSVLLACRFDSPLGPLVAAASPSGLALLEFIDRARFEEQLGRLVVRYSMPLVFGRNAHLARIEEELEGYFRGARECFEVPLDVRGTPFQLDVWHALRSIPFGRTSTYSDIAHALDRPLATRAVGRANGQNRIAIVLPCHRVVGANGTLTGYAGGLWRKRRLLELESD